jgi:hypothetical protein
VVCGIGIGSSGSTDIRSAARGALLADALARDGRFMVFPRALPRNRRSS